MSFGTKELSAKIIHDTAYAGCRFPIGAVCCGAWVQLCVLDKENICSAAELIFYSDSFEAAHNMQYENGRWAAKFEAPTEPSACFYVFKLNIDGNTFWLSASKRPHYGEVLGSRGEGFRLTVYKPDFETPSWFRKSVMYQIFPDRFSRDESDTAKRGIKAHTKAGRSIKYHENWEDAVDWKPNCEDGYYFPLDFFGGTLKGIIEKLPYLKSLGIGVIYLNPIFEAASNHRYDTGDYHKIDPVLGSNEDFISLCKSADDYGIKLILDGVFSHTGADSIYFDKYSRYGSVGAYSGGEDSPYCDWFCFGKNRDDYKSWWNFKNLPEVDENNPSWQEYIISGENSVIKTWLKSGAFGWRLDVADELPDEVLELIRKSAKEQNTNSVIIGEVWEDAVLKTSYNKRRNYALGYSLDSVMNYPFKNAVIDFLCGRASAFSLSSVLLEQRLNYPLPFYYSLMNLLGSHDTERIRTALASKMSPHGLTREQQAHFIVSDVQDAHGARMQKLAAALCYCLPGVPCIYYGDEIGMGGMRDPFCRAAFSEGKRPLSDYYRLLGEIRNANDCLKTGAVSILAPDADVIAILRATFDNKDVFKESCVNGVLLCVINRSRYKKSFVLDLYSENSGFSQSELEKLIALSLEKGSALIGNSEDIVVNEGTALICIEAESCEIYWLKPGE